MSSSTSSKEKLGQIAVKPFDHKNDKGDTRAKRWKEWAESLRISSASVFPFLAMHLRSTPDASLPRFGLLFSPAHFDLDPPGGTKWKASVKLFEISQWQLYNVLHQNFGPKETKLFSDHDPHTLGASLKAQHGWGDDHENIVFLPFAILAHNAIAAKYSETGISDALRKFDLWEKTKIFKSGKVEEWCSDLENAYNELQLSAHDREHLAALQALHSILNCGKDVWRTWAMSFATTQGQQKFTISELTEKVRAQYHLVHKKADTTSDEALIAGGSKGHQTHQRKVTHTAKKLCSVSGCNTPVAKRWQSMCMSCYKNQQNKKIADIPQATQKSNIDKAKKKAAKRLAQLNKKSKEFAAEAHMAVADNSTSDNSGVNDDNELEEPVREKPKKTKKKVTDTHVAKTIAKVPTVPFRRNMCSSLSKQGKLAMVPKSASSSKKVNKAPASAGDASVLHAYDDSLFGTTVSYFAGTPTTPIIENSL